MIIHSGTLPIVGPVGHWYVGYRQPVRGRSTRRASLLAPADCACTGISPGRPNGEFSRCRPGNAGATIRPMVHREIGLPGELRNGRGGGGECVRTAGAGSVRNRLVLPASRAPSTIGVVRPSCGAVSGLRPFHLGRRWVTRFVTRRDVGLVTVPRCDGAAMTTQMSWRRVGLFLGAAVATLLLLRTMRLGEARIGLRATGSPG